MSGFSHTQATQYGTANFWQLTDIHIVITDGVPTMTMTMLGYASQSDAESDSFQPLGTVILTLYPSQVAAFFATAQANINAFITSTWSDAVYVSS
jgi:hypothetical protein